MSMPVYVNSTTTNTNGHSYGFQCLPKHNDMQEPMAGTISELKWSPGGRYLAVNHNAALIGFQQTDNMFQQNALAATTFPDDGRNLSLVDVQVDSLQRLVPVECFGNALKLYEWCLHGL